MGKTLEEKPVNTRAAQTRDQYIKDKIDEFIEGMHGGKGPEASSKRACPSRITRRQPSHFNRTSYLLLTTSTALRSMNAPRFASPTHRL